MGKDGSLNIDIIFDLRKAIEDRLNDGEGLSTPTISMARARLTGLLQAYANVTSKAVLDDRMSDADCRRYLKDAVDLTVQHLKCIAVDLGMML